MAPPALPPDFNEFLRLLNAHRVRIRLRVPPLRIELLTSIAGVEFEECTDRAVETILDDVPVRMISLEDLKRNKRAAGRHQDLADLEHLP